VNRILFVDDEPAILDALRRSFRIHRSRWQMEFAISAARALEVLAADSVDVVVTDFRMPEMDGGQLLGLVRERWPHTARLILSGYSGLQDALTTGGLAHEYLNKPCSSEELEGAIERMLSFRRSAGTQDLTL
jgi:DNA-binding NtrC family response regulator